MKNKEQEIKEEIIKISSEPEDYRETVTKKMYNVNLLKAKLEGYQTVKQEFIEMIDKIKDKAFSTIDISFNEEKDINMTKADVEQLILDIEEELKKSLNSQETKSSNVLVECSSDLSPDKSLGGTD